MSLKDRYKTDKEAIDNGVWFEFPANSDGTVPAFLLRYSGEQNKAFTAATRQWTNKYADDNGVPDLSAVPDEVLRQCSRDVFLTTVLKDWRNFQPEDDGVNVDYSLEAAHAVLASDDWLALYTELSKLATKVGRFKTVKREAEAKNS